MDDETRAKIHKILDLVIDRNEGGNATFFEFVGHVYGVRVRLFQGKWKPDKDSQDFIHYTDNEWGWSLDEIEEELCS